MSQAVAVVKGAAAESGSLRNPLGHPDNIRMTVAFAESYLLIVYLPPDRGRLYMRSGADADA